MTRYYFSSNLKIERFCRWLCTFFAIGLVIILVLFWNPLRDTEFTYSLVSVTVSYNTVLLFFQAVTLLGSEGFFLGLFSVIYWSIHKMLGFWGLVIMPLSIFVTSEIPKDMIRLPRPDVRGVTVPTYTFPSGHTSGAVCMWGFLSIMLKNSRFWVFSLTVIILVGLSRVMLGYHFPGDILGGIVAGIIFLAVFFSLGTRLDEYHKRKGISLPFLFILALAGPMALSLLPVVYAPNLMGYLAGASLGHLVERRKVNYHTDGSMREHVFRALLGLAVIILIIPGLEMFISPRLPQLQLLTFARYALATFWVTFLAPLVFIKIGLARCG